MPDLASLPLTIIAILVAITVHECAHALAAKWLGDSTAESMGRLTLNPIAHIDPLGAILFVLVGFGWAKPVPVDPRNFRHPVRDNALVALAGPVSNLLLAFLFAVLGTVLPLGVPVLGGSALAAGDAARTMLTIFIVLSIRLNLGLMAFNLLLIPPLDGGNILRMFIPWRYADRYEDFMRYGPWILLAVLVAESFLNIPILSAWVFGIENAVLSLFALVLP